MVQKDKETSSFLALMKSVSLLNTMALSSGHKYTHYSGSDLSGDTTGQDKPQHTHTQ